MSIVPVVSGVGQPVASEAVVIQKVRDSFVRKVIVRILSSSPFFSTSVAVHFWRVYSVLGCPLSYMCATITLEKDISHFRREVVVNRTQLFLLTNYLSQYITFDADDASNGCDHTLQQTLAWIAEHHLDQETCLSWLQQRGGWCDCTIVLHVFLWEPDQLGEQTPTLPLSAFHTWQREF